MIKSNKSYTVFSREGKKDQMPDYRKNCFVLYLEDGLHGEVRKIKNNDSLTVEGYFYKLDDAPDYIVLADEREDLVKINSMSDFVHDLYMFMPGSEYIDSMGGVWDWQVKESKVIKATHDHDIDNYVSGEDDINIYVLSVIPQIGLPSLEEFTKWCVHFVWEGDMTKFQAIVYYYHVVRGISFANIARCLGKSPQNVHSMFRVADEKFENMMGRYAGNEYNKNLPGTHVKPIFSGVSPIKESIKLPPKHMEEDE